MIVLVADAKLLASVCFEASFVSVQFLAQMLPGWYDRYRLRFKVVLRPS